MGYRMLPDGKTMVMLRPQPSIRPTTQSHDECWRQDWPLSAYAHRLGDVRRCVHGRFQILTEVGPNARVAGPGSHWWRTLSRFWNLVDYRRARRALAG